MAKQLMFDDAARGQLKDGLSQLAAGLDHCLSSLADIRVVLL